MLQYLRGLCAAGVCTTMSLFHPVSYIVVLQIAFQTNTPARAGRLGRTWTLNLSGKLCSNCSYTFIFFSHPLRSARGTCFLSPIGFDFVLATRPAPAIETRKRENRRRIDFRFCQRMHKSRRVHNYLDCQRKSKSIFFGKKKEGCYGRIGTSVALAG